MQHETMNDHHIEREQGIMSAKLDTLITEVRDLKTVVHDRIDRANDKIDGIEKELNQIRGGIRVLWAVVVIIVTLAGGILLKWINT